MRKNSLLIEATIDDIAIGNSYVYRSKNTVHKVPYFAEVVGMTNKLIILSLKANQKYLRDTVSEARPYNWSIMKKDVGKSEHLYYL